MQINTAPNQASPSPLCVNSGLFVNSYISLEVIQSIDLGTHTMFICDLVESRVINDKESMSYTYYLENVKYN